MSEVTQILGQIQDGDGQAAEKLLSLVYNELRRLAAAKMAQEDPGQTLDATGLVHELVKLRYFAGFSLNQAAKALSVSRATAYRHWAYARAWLRTALLGND
jgi:DNA-directed RNA polymerase specialized sigma24 family protein